MRRVGCLLALLFLFDSGFYFGCRVTERSLLEDKQKVDAPTSVQYSAPKINGAGKSLADMIEVVQMYFVHEQSRRRSEYEEKLRRMEYLWCPDGGEGPSLANWLCYDQ